MMGDSTQTDGGRIDPEYIGLDERTVSAEFRDDELAVQHDFDRPGSREMTAPVSTQSINQYSLVDERGRSRSTSASSMTHSDRVHLLVRDGDDWQYVNPHQRYARPGGPDYARTQLDGLTIKTVSKTRGGRGHESRHHYRYKIERDLVENHDEVYLIEYRLEEGGSRDGSYSRIKNESVTRLEVSD